MRHLLDRLHGNIGFLELNIRTLDENLVSTAARSELDALRYGIAMARRY